MRKATGQRDWDLWAKQNEVNSLKKELVDLKDVQYDFFRLNDEIVNIQSKYDMVLDEQKRNEHELNKKLEINKRNISDLKADVSNIKNQIDIVNVQISNATKDNTTLRKICDNRQSEISSLNIAYSQLERTNQMQAEEYQKLSMTLKSLKLEKTKLEEERDRITKCLDENIEALKELERQARKQEANYKSLQCTMAKLQLQNKQLVRQMNAKEQILSIASRKYDQICQQVGEVQQRNTKLQKQCKKAQQQYQDYSSALHKAQSQNKQKQKHLKNLETNLLKTEQQFSITMKKRDSLKCDHQQIVTRNKDLNNQIDDSILKIMQLKKVNESLQSQIQNFITCDEQARILLNRKEKMTELLRTVDYKLLKSGEPIAHLRI